MQKVDKDLIKKLLRKSIDDAQDKQAVYTKINGFECFSHYKPYTNGEKLQSSIELIISMLSD